MKYDHSIPFDMQKKKSGVKDFFKKEKGIENRKLKNLEHYIRSMICTYI